MLAIGAGAVLQAPVASAQSELGGSTAVASRPPPDEPDDPAATTSAPDGEEETAETTERSGPIPSAFARSVLRYWSSQEARPFVSGAFDVGYLYLRPRFSFGYGQPFARWFGIDVNPIFSSEGVGAWAGLRGALPAIDLRAGARYFFTFNRSFLTPEEHYERLDIESRQEVASRYLALEAELTLDIPMGPGSFYSELAATYLLFVEEGLHVFEETIRVVADPPWIWRTRIGYGFRVGPEGLVGLRPVAELVGSPGRDMIMLRAGLEVTMALFSDLELRGRWIAPIVSRDSLGAAGGDSFQLGVRYRWASGEPDGDAPSAE